MLKKIELLLLILVVVLSSFVGCSNTENAISNNEVSDNELIIEPINISVYGLNGPTSIGMIKLFEEKPLLAENVITNYNNVSQPDLLIGKLINSEIDIAAVPTNVASIIYNKTEGKYQVAAVNTLGVLYIMTAEGVEINSLGDLRGKTIGASGLGSTPEYVLNHVLTQNKIIPDEDITIDYSLSHADLAQGLISGNVEIALLPQPFVTMVTMNSNAKIALSLQDEWSKIEDSNLAMGCILVKTELAETRPDIINTFLDNYEISVNWVNENPVEASLLVEKFEVLPKAKIAELAIPYSSIVFLSDEECIAEMKGILSVLFDFNPKSIGGKLPDENFYYKK